MKKLICILFVVVSATFFATAMAATKLSGSIMNASLGDRTIQFQSSLSSPVFQKDQSLPKSVTTQQRIASYSVTPPEKGFSNDVLFYGTSVSGCAFYFNTIEPPLVNTITTMSYGNASCKVSGHNLSVTITGP